jgi:cytochrome c553
MAARSAAALLAGALLVGGPLWAQAPAAGPEACTACHGPGGNSVVPSIPSIAGQPRTFVENQLVLIREGLRDVPSMKAVMGTLNDEQIVALARHFSAQPVAAPGAPRRAEPFKAGAVVSQRALCGTCHLPTYAGQNQVPRLAGQHEAYLLATMKMYRDKPDPGRDTAMSAALFGLKDADLAALAHYLSQQGP